MHVRAPRGRGRIYFRTRDYFVLKMSGVAPETAILVAFGTSLAVALPTVLTSALGHTRKGNVIWRDAAVIGIAGLVTGYIGGTVATYLPVAVLTFLFGVMLIIGAVRMVTALPSGAAQSLSNTRWHRNRGNNRLLLRSPGRGQRNNCSTDADDHRKISDAVCSGNIRRGNCIHYPRRHRFISDKRTLCRSEPVLLRILSDRLRGPGGMNDSCGNSSTDGTDRSEICTGSRKKYSENCSYY